MALSFSLCIGQIEASTCPPGQPPGHLTFLKIIVQISPYPGQNAVQMPHTRVHSGYQMPPPRPGLLQTVLPNCLRDRAREMIEVHTRPSHARASSYAKRHEARPLKEESLTYLMQPEVISSCKCFSATEQFITQCCCFRSPFTCFLLLCPSL